MHALYVVDIIDNMETSVHTYVDGFAASAATLLSVVGDKRFMSKHSLMLIHQLSTSSAGKYQDLQQNMENVDNMMNIIENIYLEKTKIPKKYLIEILKKDLWLDSQTCLKYGLVDYVGKSDVS
jgi:ATP-dependent protease ClpP protease subunit